MSDFNLDKETTELTTAITSWMTKFHKAYSAIHTANNVPVGHDVFITPKEAGEVIDQVKNVLDTLQRTESLLDHNLDSLFETGYACWDECYEDDEKTDGDE
jgi:hypothetical protein